MKTITKEAYQIDEHPDPDSVFNWMRTHWAGYGWHEDNVASLRAFLESYGVPFDKVRYEYGLCRRGFVTLPEVEITDYRDRAWRGQEEPTGVRVWKWLENNGHFDHLGGDCPFTGYCFDEVLLDEIRVFRAKPDDRTLNELLRDCCQAWLKAATDDLEYSQSDEALLDQCQAGEYHFFEDGEAAA